MILMMEGAEQVCHTCSATPFRGTGIIYTFRGAIIYGSLVWAWTGILWPLVRRYIDEIEALSEIYTMGWVPASFDSIKWWFMKEKGRTYPKFNKKMMKTKSVELIFPVISGLEWRSQRLSKPVSWAKYFLCWIEKWSWTGHQSNEITPNFGDQKLYSKRSFFLMILAWKTRFFLNLFFLNFPKTGSFIPFRTVLQ